MSHSMIRVTTNLENIDNVENSGNFDKLSESQGKLREI